MITPARLLLLVAGIATLATGAVHFGLPMLYDWEPHLRNLVDSLRWALYAINAFFSVLLLLAGAATIHAARSASPDRTLVAGMTIFWLFNLAYQLTSPFPEPTVRWIARGFALLLFACYAVAFLLTRREAVRT